MAPVKARAEPGGASPVAWNVAMVDVEMLYRQQLTDTDRQVLASAAHDGDALTVVLGRPELEALVFHAAEGRELEPSVSPFLVFATAVHRTAVALDTATFVEERFAPRVRIPLFDVSSLRALLDDPLRRYFLVELLASYTRVTSGVTWVRSGQRWRRRRFSELDPVRLAGLLEVVEPSERPGVYRRLGDLALFLCGVFPDRDHLPLGAAGDRVLRLSGVDLRTRDDLSGMALLELLGARWYAAAASGVAGSGRPLTATLAVARHMGEHFAEARRVLNTVTDRYLFPYRQWFGVS